MDEKTRSSETVVGAYEAKTRFSELIARAEKGENFVVTKNGRPVARITPSDESDVGKAQRAGDAIRALLAVQGPPVSKAEAQRNWETLKADIDRDRDGRIDRWLKS